MTQRASGLDGVRRANLATVLRLVHEGGPRSRALLTAETGLNRSTIAHLVADLAAQQLVVEFEPDPARRVGRPSPMVAPSDDVIAFGVNPEVDAIEVGAVSLAGVVRERRRIECARRPSVTETVEIVSGAIQEMRAGALSGARFVGAGVAVPGLVHAESGIVRLAPHLEWRDADVAGPLEAAIGLPVLVDNDASLGILAERLFGAARDHADVVYLNGGASGIGGGIIMRGILIGGADGFAGEWGQTSLIGGGVLEDAVSRARLLQAAGLGPVGDDGLAEALSAPGAALAAEVERQRGILAVALANAINVINPSKIVLGGFLALLREQDPAAFDADVRDRALAAPAERVELASAALGADRLLIGAAEAAFGPLLADPAAG